ncbi:MAG: type IV pilus twitching motility protein PilT [Candidatus Omnitrophica bacterium]|nr:type IV pilus twitching motility protein PilT [Candidatus Omnitrophota bacterium]
MEPKKLFETIVKKDISDLHLSVGLPPMMRQPSSIEPIESTCLTENDIKGILLEIMSEERLRSLEQGIEIDMGHTIEGLARFRINVYRDRKGICAAFRLVPQRIKALDTLGLPAAVRKICEMQRGLVLVTGPTGSGKSTTLASIINKINLERSGHIITLEDPIEYLHEHNRCIINQREVGTDTASFSAGLRAALREDPDIILVGEMRDLDTISNAVTAAETGHLVLATLHTRNASQSVSRIIDVFPAEQQAQIRVQFAEAAALVVSQTLVPSRDGLTRHLATEVMVNNTAIRNLIRENKTFQIKNIIEAGGKEGMQTMDQSLKFLLQSNKIDQRTARKYSFEKHSFI